MRKTRFLEEFNAIWYGRKKLYEYLHETEIFGRSTGEQLGPSRTGCPPTDHVRTPRIIREIDQKGGACMSKILNLDGHLVCMFDEETGAIEIRRKGCITLIYWDASGKPIVLNSKE